MKKPTIIILVTLLVVSVGSLVFANAPGSFYHHSGYGYNGGPVGTPLTDEQKAQIEQLTKQRFEQRKKMLSDQVSWGWISKEESNREIAWMEQNIANGNYNVTELGAHHNNHGRGEHGGTHW